MPLESARELARKAESSSARLRASIEKGAEDTHLYIRNHGLSEARAIRVVLDNVPITEHERALVDGKGVPAVLGPGASVRYILIQSMGGPSRHSIDVTWGDDTGAGGRWRSDLSAYYG